MATTEEKQSLLDKATTQNVVAGLVIIVATAATIYFQKWELLGVITGAAIGYLFPKVNH